MKCPYCGADNRAGAKFCRVCGRQLPANVPPSSAANRPKVFITHSWNDIEFARRLYQDLKTLGFPLWFDDKTLKPGHRLAQEISQGLEWCDIYIPVISRAALASKWCWEEINAAITLSNRTGRGDRPRIISALAEDCEHELPALLGSRMYINFARNYDTSLRELIEKGFRPSGATLMSPSVGVSPPTPPPASLPEHKSPPAAPSTRRGFCGGVAVGVIGVIIVLVIGVILVLNLVYQTLATPARVAFATPTYTARAPTATRVPPTLAPATPTTPPTLAPTKIPATPTRVPTPTDPRGRLVLYDTFDSNVNNWEMGETSYTGAKTTRSISNGKYRWDAKAITSGFNDKATPRMSAVSDFYVAAEVRRVSGPTSGACGILFRIYDYENLYYFWVNGDGYTGFNMLSNNQWATPKYFGSISAFTPNGTNALAVRATGTHFAFYINDQYVGEVYDSTLSSGTVGLAIDLYNAGDTAIFEFDNFELRAP